jgi:hypothetical protein
MDELCPSFLAFLQHRKNVCVLLAEEIGCQLEEWLE